MAERLALTVPEAAERIGVSPDSLRKAVARGDIRSIRFAGRILVPVVELERILGIERAQPANADLVEAFAKLLGVELQAVGD